MRASVSPSRLPARIVIVCRSLSLTRFLSLLTSAQHETNSGGRSITTQIAGMLAPKAERRGPVNRADECHLKPMSIWDGVKYARQR